MSTCYHPNIIIQDRDKWNPNTGRNFQQAAFINSFSKDFKGYEFYEKFNNDPKLNNNGKYRAVRANCGNKCIGCLEQVAKEWAVRVCLENNYHDECYMITLTYNDTWLPIKSQIEIDGKIYVDDGTWNSYLRDEDAKKFIKDFRNQQYYRYGITGIKYFGCGEYGGKDGRAHWHIIFMGAHIPKEDLKVHSIDTEGNFLYECKNIEDIWDNKGFITVTEVNYQVARYVAGYVQKKEFKLNKHDMYEYFTHKEAFYARRGQTPERRFMSKGIGGEYYKEHKIDIFEDGYIWVFGAKQEIIPASIPRIYSKWLEGECEPMAEKVKLQKQEAAIRNQQNKMAQTSLTIKEQLEVEERTKINKMEIFKHRDKL